MVDASILLAFPWTFLHFAAMFAFGLTSVETFALYLVASFIITNVLVGLLNSREYLINKLRFSLYVCAVVVPVVFKVALFAVRLCRSIYLSMADPILAYASHIKPKLLGDASKDTPHCWETRD